MTVDEKNRIIMLRTSGRSLTEIAEETGISRNTVKSFCRRQGLTGDTIANPKVAVTDSSTVKPCQCCGKAMTLYPGHRERKFCSDKCRLHYWNTHLGKTRLTGMVEYTCPVCGELFYAYPNRQRKYCSHACYIEARFGGAVCE